jgi:hypothetical protein
MYIIKLRITFDARNSIIVADHYLTKETKIINQKRMQNFKIKPLKYKKISLVSLILYYIIVYLRN